jgi:hypothetical protein
LTRFPGRFPLLRTYTLSLLEVVVCVRLAGLKGGSIRDDERPVSGVAGVVAAVDHAVSSGVNKAVVAATGNGGMTRSAPDDASRFEEGGVYAEE